MVNNPALAALEYAGGDIIAHVVEGAAERVVHDIGPAIDSFHKYLSDLGNRIVGIGEHAGEEFMEKIEEFGHDLYTNVRPRKRSKGFHDEEMKDDIPDVEDEDVMQTEIPQIEYPSVIDQIQEQLGKMEDELPVSSDRASKSFPYSMVGYKRRRRGSRRSKKKVTKRGVKAIIKKQAAWLGDGYCEYSTSQAGAFYTSLTGQGHIPAFSVPPAYPTLVHNCKGYKTHGFLHKASLDDMMLKNEQNADVTFTTQAPDPDSIKFHWKKAQVDFEFHNPMTELVKFRCWVFKAMDDGVGDIYTVWDEQEKKLRTPDLSGPATEALNTVWKSYPSRFEYIRENYKLVHKYKTLFQPGQSKKLKIKLGAGTYSKLADNPNGFTYIKNKSFQILFECQGMVTHLNSAAQNNPSIVCYSGVGLEYVFNFTALTAWSLAGAKWTQVVGTNTVAAVTIAGAATLQPQNEGTVRTV